MIKRMTKITSLLVCAASIVSIIPAYAADVKKIDSQEGTIYSAKAKGKTIYIDGEINGKDEAQYWMTDDGKYNAISGLSDGMPLNDLLLNKYAELDDQHTYFDVTDGKYTITDDTVRANLQDDVASIIRKKIKSDDDGRFSDKDKSLPNTIKFSEAGNGLTCFKDSNGYTLKSDKQFQGKTSDAIYGDYAGNYVDADYNLGSIKVSTTSNSVYVKNTGDTYELKDGNTTYELRAVIADKSYITTVGDNMYRWASLTMYARVKGSTSDSDYKALSTYTTGSSPKFLFGGKYGATAATVTVLQSFSKTVATDTINGIKYSKDSTIYFGTNDSGVPFGTTGNTDIVLGLDKAASATKSSVTADSTNDGVKITGNAQGFCSAYFSANAKKVFAQTLKLKSKEGLNYIDLGNTDSTDVADKYTSIQTAGGFVWALDGGYIKAWDGDESFAKVYKVDGSMNSMSISSKDNIIVWNEDDEVYSIIHNAAPAKDAAATTGTTTAKDGAATTTATTTAAAGWVKATDGTWSYNKTGGVKATGWLQDGATWYYLNATGVMQTGWINDNGTWYYCNGSGAMLANTTVDGYVLGASGAWIK